MKLNLNKISLLEYLAINQPVKKSYREIAEDLKMKRTKRIIKYRYVFFKPTKQYVFLLIKALLKSGEIKKTKQGYYKVKLST